MASGALRGEKFNSVNEQGNSLIVALADSMGVSIGQMRQMAAAGKLTTDVVVNGLLSQGTAIGNEFANHDNYQSGIAGCREQHHQVLW
jgi:phage-related minor tail protein